MRFHFVCVPPLSLPLLFSPALCYSHFLVFFFFFRSYRGASPLQFCLLHNDRSTAISLIAINSVIDAGDILAQDMQRVHAADTFDMLFTRLSNASSTLLLQTLARLAHIIAHTQHTQLSIDTPQHVQHLLSHTHLHTRSALERRLRAPKIPRHLGHLSFTRMNAYTVRQLFRGLHGFTPVYTYLNGTQVLIVGMLLNEESAQRREDEEDRKAQQLQQLLFDFKLGSTPAIPLPSSIAPDFPANAAAPADASASSDLSSILPVSTCPPCESAGHLSWNRQQHTLDVVCADGEVVSLTHVHVQYRARAVAADEFLRGHLQGKLPKEQWKFQ